MIAHIDSPLERVEVYFAPDQPDAPASPEPHVVDGDSWLMVRGEFPRPQSELMPPSTARF